jgi:hypothetical protein
MAQKPESCTVNARNVKILAVVVVALFAAMFALNSGDRDDSPAGNDLLFPELKSGLNDLDTVTVTDADGTITLQRESDGESDGGRWVAPDHDRYPADTGDLRQLLLALAEARKLEQKTSDPELYERLGVDDPRDDGGDGVLVSAKGDNAAVSLILGSTAQGEFRFARIPEEAQSWLINQNPVIPDDRAGWLAPDIVDIDSTRIQSASIRHADGEVIRVRKQDEDAVNFEVEDIPEGRELRYPSVANSIAGVLGNLTLEDVRKADTSGGLPAATAEFSTFDGLDIGIAVRAIPVGEETDGKEADADSAGEYWIMVNAAARAAGDAESETEAEPGAEPTADAESRPEADENAADGQARDEAAANVDDGAAVPAEQERNPADEADLINERVAGWSYRISSYKADQLMRRWDDLLSDVDDDNDSD